MMQCASIVFFTREGGESLRYLPRILRAFCARFEL
jgi:hypothetical protein